MAWSGAFGTPEAMNRAASGPWRERPGIIAAPVVQRSFSELRQRLHATESPPLWQLPAWCDWRFFFSPVSTIPASLSSFFPVPQSNRYSLPSTSLGTRRQRCFRAFCLSLLPAGFPRANSLKPSNFLSHKLPARWAPTGLLAGAGVCPRHDKTMCRRFFVGSRPLRRPLPSMTFPH